MRQGADPARPADAAPPREEPSDDVLAAAAEGLRARMAADLVTVLIAPGTAGEPPLVRHAAAPALSRVVALARGVEVTGLSEAARIAGAPIVCEQIGARPSALPGLARVAADGAEGRETARLLARAGAIGVPLGPPEAPEGAVVAVRLDDLDSDAMSLAIRAAEPIILAGGRAARAGTRARRAQALAGALAATADAVALEWDASGRLVDWSGDVEGLLGLDPAGLHGMRASAAAPLLARAMTDPAAAGDRFGLPLTRALEPEHLLTADGRELRHERRPVDGDGRAGGAVDVLLDVTRERRALSATARLAAEKAELVGREERRMMEEVALSRAAHAMTSEITRTEVHARLLEEARRLVPCDKAAVLEVDARGDVLPVATWGFAETTVRRMMFRAGEGVAGTVIARREPFRCDDVQSDPRVSRRITGPEGIRSFMHVPIVLGDRVHGLVSVNSTRPRAFSDRDQRILTELARHAATALGNAGEYEQERHVAEILQRSLLADELPSIPGLEIATLYRPSEGALVGGDLYSVWTLGPDRAAVLLGDVSGKGVEAASLTAMVRYMAEALARSSEDPGVILGELNRLLWGRIPDAAIVTALLVVIDTSRATLRWTCAGHPPPLLITAGRRVTELYDPDPPCGAFADTRFTTHVETFAEGDVLFAYTDGLTEARRGDEEFGEVRVRRAVLESLGEPARGLARQVYAAARAWTGGHLDDDVAVAAIRRVAGD